MSFSGIKSKNRRPRIKLRFHLIRLFETQEFKGSNNSLLVTISSVHLTYRPITSLTSTLNCTTSSLARKGPPGCCESSIKYRPLQGSPDQMSDSGIQEIFAFKIRSLGLEIQNSGKKIRNRSWGWNTESKVSLTKNPEFRTWKRNPESVLWNPESKF